MTDRAADFVACTTTQHNRTRNGFYFDFAQTNFQRLRLPKQRALKVTAIIGLSLYGIYLACWFLAGVYIIVTKGALDAAQ